MIWLKGNAADAVILRRIPISPSKTATAVLLTKTILPAAILPATEPLPMAAMVLTAIPPTGIPPATAIPPPEIHRQITAALPAAAKPIQIPEVQQLQLLPQTTVQKRLPWI